MEELSKVKKDRNLRRKTVDISTMVFGKVPPQARDLEEAVLGAIMLEKVAFDTAIELLKPECFYVEAHQRIFAAMKRLAAKSFPVDILTVVEEMKLTGELDLVGGPYFVTKLTNSVVSSANIEAHARIILQKFIQRELIRISGEIIGEAYEDTTDVFNLLDSAETKLFGITDNNLRQNFKSIDHFLVKVIKQIEDLKSRKEDITGIHSGFPSLDKITNGWQPTDLIILAARPSVGKTAFALNLARNAALHPKRPVPVAVFSLEMSCGQIVQRLLASETGINLSKISTGKLEDHEFHQLNAGVQKLGVAPIYLDDTAALNIFELRAKCRRLKGKYNIGLIVIDYLQLMSGTGENRNTNREQEISKISRDLKGLAKELQVPVIALSQLSREVEKRKERSRKPQLSDLRESGAIEQDADLVMFLYRPEADGLTENEMGEAYNGRTDISIAKHRNGPLDTVGLRLLSHIQRFEEAPLKEFGNDPFSGMRKPGDNEQHKIYIEKGSRMNDMDFNDQDNWTEENPL
ncbi:MAG TPA: replicative DNA helicase [Chitinophagaceae bacterium]|nr:replicative DNA helicase [Chitinophagaceae bacterium]